MNHSTRDTIDGYTESRSVLCIRTEGKKRSKKIFSILKVSKLENIYGRHHSANQGYSRSSTSMTRVADTILWTNVSSTGWIRIVMFALICAEDAPDRA